MWRSIRDPIPQAPVPAGYTLRTLRPGEEAEWVRMRNEAFRQDGKPDWDMAAFVKAFMSRAVFEYERVFVVVHDGRLVGTSTAWELDEGGGPVGWVHMFGVEPAHRGKGLGAALMARVLRELRARGYALAGLTTSPERQAAVRVYERMGFRAGGRRGPFDAERREPCGACMRKESV